MLKTLLDIAPFPNEVPIPDEEITEILEEAIPADTVGGTSPALIVAAILAALIALGICLMIVRRVRKNRVEIE